MKEWQQISMSTYLDCVRNKAAICVDLSQKIEDLRLLLGSEAEVDELRQKASLFQVPVDDGFVGVPVFVPLDQVSLLWGSNFNVGNWHYDRKAACLMVNLRVGRHEHLCALLHQIYVGSEPLIESAAEKFIDEGLGWFKSSASFGRFLIGDKVRFSAQERTAFGALKKY